MTSIEPANNRKITDISFILKDLLKVIKIVSMYPETNPLPQSLKRSFAEKLESIVEEYGDLPVEVRRDCLTYQEEVVFQDRSDEENLAQIFFSSGITDFTFKTGLEVGEIYKLLDAIKTYINAPGKTLDLANLIWECALDNFSFRTLEDISLSEYDQNFNIQEYLSTDRSRNSNYGNFGTESADDYMAIFDASQGSGSGSLSIFTDDEESRRYLASELGLTASRESDEVEARPVSPGPMGTGNGKPVPPGARMLHSAGAASPEPADASESAIDSDDGEQLQYGLLDDDHFQAVEAAMGFTEAPASPAARVPDTTLILNDEFRLSEEEEQLIVDMIHSDTEFDPYESTLSLLKEMLAQETEIPGLDETVTICEKMLSEFVTAARLIEAGRLLQHIKQLQREVTDAKPHWAERLHNFYITAASRERLQILGETLNNNARIGVYELKSYLGNFGWEALGGIADLAGIAVHEHHKNCLLDYLTEQGKTKVDAVAKGIFDKRIDVVRNSVSILARIGGDRAFTYLLRAMEHEDELVRLELVMALKDSPNSNVLEILKRAVADASSRIRREAVKSIAARRGKEAFDTIAEIINDANFLSLDRVDQQSLLTAYSVLGGDSAVTYLERLITTYNIFRDHSLTFFRQAAFEALSVNRSEKCEQVLLKLSGSWRSEIKTLAQTTLRRRREIIYGGE